jgi:hypothetical protein
MRHRWLGGGARVRRLSWTVATIATAVLAAAPVEAQERGAVVLRIKPAVGDTLYTRFEQQVEMSGSTRFGDTDTTLVMHTSMLMLSRVLVQEADDDGTTVVTVTDSLAVQSTGAQGAMPPESVRQAMEGARLRMRITPEGSATILNSPDELTPDLQAVISQMPATLPSKPVPVGGSWSQVMSIPLANQAARDGDATLETTYRLDSLSADGTIAYISMHGTLSRDSTAATLPHGVKFSSTGSMTGQLLVDRARGWWSESAAIISFRSTLTPPPGGTAQPVHFQVRIVQRMHSREQP